MFKKNGFVKINMPGGIMPAGNLYSILQAADDAHVEEVQFGLRQQMFIKVADKYIESFLAELDKHSIFYELNEDAHPNILSSYVAEDVFENSNWLSESVYKDIFDQFDFRPGLKVNIVDSVQSFAPFFTGNINFISSGISNYWYLYIRFPKTNILYAWGKLIYSLDIPRLTKLIETTILANRDLFYATTANNGNTLETIVHAKETFITQPVAETLQLPEFALPYYEGFNRYANKTWLGIYRRDEMYSVPFLKDICSICINTKVGRLYTTPWKSIIIKGIEQQDRKLWEYALGRYRINVRHASNELAWQIEDMNDEGLALKRYIIRQFDRDDVRTFGLCFAVKTQPQTGLFGSVIIKKCINTSASGRKSLDRYDILYTKDFNPNSKELVVFRKEVEKENLGVYLISLCKYFYKLQSQEDLIPHHVYQLETKEVTEEGDTENVYQCKHCFTIYDEAFGDEYNDIPAGTPFINVKEDYACNVCGAPKADFVAVEKQNLKFS